MDLNHHLRKFSPAQPNSNEFEPKASGKVRSRGVGLKKMPIQKRKGAVSKNCEFGWAGTKPVKINVQRHLTRFDSIKV